MHAFSARYLTLACTTIFRKERERENTILSRLYRYTYVHRLQLYVCTRTSRKPILTLMKGYFCYPPQWGRITFREIPYYYHIMSLFCVQKRLLSLFVPLPTVLLVCHRLTLRASPFKGVPRHSLNFTIISIHLSTVDDLLYCSTVIYQTAAGITHCFSLSFFREQSRENSPCLPPSIMDEPVHNSGCLLLLFYFEVKTA